MDSEDRRQIAEAYNTMFVSNTEHFRQEYELDQSEMVVLMMALAAHINESVDTIMPGLREELESEWSE